ncbi:MAG: EVE domain-containing protein [Cyclobacteriaceae bacterium]
MNNYWLVKSEPEEYGFAHLQKDGTGRWDGVRNYQARNFMNEMSPGDNVLFYHSGKNREVVGLAEVVKASYPDPTAPPDKDWVAVDLKAIAPLESPVCLSDLKSVMFFSDFLLVKQPRLSVMPVPPDIFKKILKLGGRN